MLLRASTESFPTARPQPTQLLGLCVQSHLWVAAAVSSLAAYTSLRSDVELSMPGLLLVWFSTLLIYNLDTALDLHAKSKLADAATSTSALVPPRLRHARWLALLAGLGLLVALAGAAPLSAALVIAGASFCCSYSLPLGTRRLRLKALPGFKSFLVGGAVAVATVSVPLTEAGQSWSFGSWQILWFVATLTTYNATLFDIRDLTYDQKRRLRTLPVLFGLARTRLGLACVGGGSFLLLAISAPHLRLEALSQLCLLLPLTFLLGPNSPRSAYAWLVDGTLFLPWLLASARLL